MDNLPVHEVPFEWYLPPIKHGPFSCVDSEEENTIDSPTDSPEALLLETASPAYSLDFSEDSTLSSGEGGVAGLVDPQTPEDPESVRLAAKCGLTAGNSLQSALNVLFEMLLPLP